MNCTRYPPSTALCATGAVIAILAGAGACTTGAVIAMRRSPLFCPKM